ncbi:unnamed protein product [Oikopleura dioica]|uniref:3CxxC-type domain-containing protein n=1 Tax=Oikopleura dioica TaxID=34765 RepID=E4WQG9_OIKDI|nr:unnamed protein product [Oikopleura dioica]
MHVERFFHCSGCETEFSSNTGERKKRCPRIGCRKQVTAKDDYWSIKRVLHCDYCDCNTTSDAYGINAVYCARNCGNVLEWAPTGGTIQRFFRCKNCKKNYESVAHRQTEIKCPYVGCKQKLYPLKSKTKFHGKLFGKYRCSSKNCNKTWTSAYAYKDHYQECKSCKSRSYPHHLIEHHHDGKVGDKEHLSELCGKCKSGDFCRDATRSKKRYDDISSLTTGISRISMRKRYEASPSPTFTDDYDYGYYD